MTDHPTRTFEEYNEHISNVYERCIHSKMLNELVGIMSKSLCVSGIQEKEHRCKQQEMLSKSKSGEFAAVKARFALGNDDGAYLRCNVMPLQTAVDEGSNRLNAKITADVQRASFLGLLDAYDQSIDRELDKTKPALQAFFKTFKWMVSIKEVKEFLYASVHESIDGCNFTDAASIIEKSTDDWDSLLDLQLLSTYSKLVNMLRSLFHQSIANLVNTQIDTATKIIPSDILRELSNGNATTDNYNGNGVTDRKWAFFGEDKNPVQNPDHWVQYALARGLCAERAAYHQPSGDGKLPYHLPFTRCPSTEEISHIKCAIEDLKIPSSVFLSNGYHVADVQCKDDFCDIKLEENVRYAKWAPQGTVAAPKNGDQIVSKACILEHMIDYYKDNASEHPQDEKTYRALAAHTKLLQLGSLAAIFSSDITNIDTICPSDGYLTVPIKRRNGRSVLFDPQAGLFKFQLVEIDQAKQLEKAALQLSDAQREVDLTKQELEKAKTDVQKLQQRNSEMLRLYGKLKDEATDASKGKKQALKGEQQALAETEQAQSQVNELTELLRLKEEELKEIQRFSDTIVTASKKAIEDQEKSAADLLEKYNKLEQEADQNDEDKQKILRELEQARSVIDQLRDRIKGLETDLERAKKETTNTNPSDTLKALRKSNEPPLPYFKSISMGANFEGGGEAKYLGEATQIDQESSIVFSEDPPTKRNVALGILPSKTGHIDALLGLTSLSKILANGEALTGHHSKLIDLKTKTASSRETLEKHELSKSADNYGQTVVNDISSKRREEVWNDSMREAAIAGDRLYAFVRQLSGTIHEQVDSVCVVDESMLIRQQKDREEDTKRLSMMASQQQMQLVSNVFKSVISESGLTLGIDNKRGLDGELKVVSNTLRKQVSDLTNGSSSSEGFFSNSVKLEQLLAQGTGELTLSGLFDRLQGVGKQLQESVLQNANGINNTNNTAPSLEFLSSPRNSLLLRWKPESHAAIRQAFDTFHREMNAVSRKHGTLGYDRKISAYELIEGRNDELSMAFATYCAHVLAHQRMFSVGQAPYLGQWAARANMAAMKFSCDKLIAVAHEYVYNNERPKFLDEKGWDMYFS